MATTPAGAALTDRFHSIQSLIADRTVNALNNLWMLLTVDGSITESEWVEAAVSVLRASHGVSERVARGYYQAYRTAELGVYEQVRQFGGRAFLANRAAHRAAAYPAYFRRLIGEGVTVEQAGAKAARELTGELVELALDGGRYTVIETVQVDDRAVGWYRVTDSDPCAFCALMASRGAVYKSQSSASFRAHWRCNCAAEAAYTRSRYPNDAAKQWGDLYNRSTRGSRDPLNAFRRAYERPRLHS